MGHRYTDDKGIVRTFASGPSDPVRHADGPGTEVEVHVDAPPEKVWEQVVDIELPARFSEEFLGASWQGDGPALGATFVGRNTHPAIGEWEVPCFVDAYEEGRVFGWCTSDPENPGARWRYELDPDDDGGTRLRYSVTIGPGPSGITMAIAGMPDREARILERRVEEHHANMTRVVEGIRDAAESG